MAEAERILGAPESTIRRWIRQGRVTGEQVLRDPDNPRDTRLVWRVLVSDGSPAATSSESEQPPDMRQEPPEPATATTAALETIAGLVERNAVLSDRIAALEREAGQLEGRATILRAELEQAIEAHARCTNLTNAEAHRIFEEAREQRERAEAAEARAEQFAAERARATDLAERLAEAERRLARRRWWRVW
jgi:chromosome segregation ATPase